MQYELLSGGGFHYLDCISLGLVKIWVASKLASELTNQLTSSCDFTKMSFFVIFSMFLGFIFSNMLFWYSKTACLHSAAVPCIYNQAKNFVLKSHTDAKII